MKLVLGVDEAGRGALAGPVAAAAVALHPERIPDGIADSKTLTAEQRVTLAEQIRSHALAWSVVLIDHLRIDEVNILQATFDAMHGAIDNAEHDLHELGHTVELLLIDGNRFRPHRLAHECWIKGDARNVSIGAASILAKTTRDAWMTDVAHPTYPVYGFAQHKGYGTLKHRQAILTSGPCAIHRITFLTKLLTSVSDAQS